jgi:hypothetical protein
VHFRRSLRVRSGPKSDKHVTAIEAPWLSAFGEHKLLRLAYAYEQASRMRKPPPGLPAV